MEKNGRILFEINFNWISATKSIFFMRNLKQVSIANFSSNNTIFLQTNALAILRVMTRFYIHANTYKQYKIQKSKRDCVLSCNFDILFNIDWTLNSKICGTIMNCLKRRHLSMACYVLLLHFLYLTPMNELANVQK